jgi:transcriptional regulator GlxA family with amidase domain
MGVQTSGGSAILCGDMASPVLRSRAPVSIAILCYEGCLGMEVFGIADLLMVANRVAVRLAPSKPAPFIVRVCSAEGGTIALAGGFHLETRRPPAGPTCLVVPGFDFTRLGLGDGVRLDRELAVIRRHFRSGALLTTVCVGAFLLAEAGALHDRRATTAWLCRDAFARRHPAVRLADDQALVADGQIVTTGSISACHDLALHLVERYAGAAVATATANIALVNTVPRSQAPYVDGTWRQALDPPFAASVKAWLGNHLAEPFVLSRLAAACHVSPRTLLRRFKQETGTSPLTHLQGLRVDAAKRLLLQQNRSVAAAAEAVGYTDVGTFIQLFKRHVKLTPAAYRRQFAALRGESSADGSSAAKALTHSRAKLGDSQI